jgi:hypothetical protein
MVQGNNALVVKGVRGDDGPLDAEEVGAQPADALIESKAKPKKVVPLPDSTVQTMLQSRVVTALNALSAADRALVLAGFGHSGPSYILFVNGMPLDALTMLATELGIDVPAAPAA